MILPSQLRVLESGPLGRQDARTGPNESDTRPRFGEAHRGERGRPKMEAYCLKCRTKREMANPAPVTMKNGKTATRGKCPVCGTQMYRIGKS